MKYVGYLYCKDGLVWYDTICWSHSLQLVKLFLDGIKYYDKKYDKVILSSEKNDFSDIKMVELNGFLDLDTQIGLYTSEDKTTSIISTPLQIDYLTSDFDTCRGKLNIVHEDEFYNNISNSLEYIENKKLKNQLREFVLLAYGKYRTEYVFNTGNFDTIKFLVLYGYIKPFIGE